MAQPKKNYTLLPQGEDEPLTGNRQYKRWNQRWICQWIIPGLLAIVVIIALVISQTLKHGDDSHSPPLKGGDACPQFPALQAPSETRKSFEEDLKKELSSEDFFKESTKRMQGAVQIPTEIFDDMGEVGEDKRWEVFIPFQNYLKETFPLV